MQATLFEHKGPSYQFSKHSPPTFYQATVREAKERLAPTHYSSGNILESYKKNNENFTGRYSKGVVKTNSPQLHFANDAQAHGMDTPQPGYYDVKKVSTTS